MNCCLRLPIYFLLSLAMGLLPARHLAAQAQAAVVLAGDTMVVSLGDAIARATEVSPDVLTRGARTRFAQARLAQARRSRVLPEASANSAVAVAPGLENPNGTVPDRLYLDPDVRNDWEALSPFGQLEVDLVQPLWTWGQIGRSIDAARAGVAVEEGAYAEAQLEVALRTGELYYSVVLLKALDRLALEAGDVVARARREVERMLADGAEDVGDADLYQVLITEQEVRKRVVRVRQESRTARVGLRRQLMLGDAGSVDVADVTLEPLPFILDSLEAYQEMGLAHRPEMIQAEAGRSARAALVDVARSDFYPKLFWGVQARYAGTTADRFRQRNPYVGDPLLSRSVETGFGVRMQLNYPLIRARVRQAEANLEEVRHQETGARQLILFEIERAYRTVVVRQEEVAAAEEALRLSREWLQTEYVNFDLDLGDTEDLIRAVQANLELQAGRHQAVFDLNMAILRLMAATGVVEPLLAY